MINWEQFFYGSDQNHADYYGSKSSNHSDKTASIIDEEVKNIVDNALVKATKILTSKKKDLEILARALLEFETLTGDQIKDLLDGKDIKKEIAENKKPKASFIPDIEE